MERATEPTDTKNANLMSRGKEQFESIGHRAVEGIDQATTTLGSGVEHAGASMQRAGRYLQDSDPKAMKQDILETLRSHPGATFAVGVGIGVLLTRAFGPRR